jgi:triosephosphate isomerase
MRKKIVAGNWKMNKTLKEGILLFEEINNKLEAANPGDVEVVICSPFIHLGSLNNYIFPKPVKTGAQNCSSEESGAYTGEVSAAMIKSTGAEYVIIGHSERRSYFEEKDETLTKKVRCALDNELKVIFCCGEVLKDRENNNHFSLVEKQLQNGLFNLDIEDMADVIIAYEPVWAIGTGVTASSDQAQEMHNFIRSLIISRYTAALAQDTTILYGGSCNPANAKELFAMDDVDGGLIGGASLKPDDFISIVNSY